MRKDNMKINLLFRKLLRKIGFNIHAGWQTTHRSGCEIKCVGCGERRSLMSAWVKPAIPDWWETSESGNGNCGQIKELEAKFY